MIMCKYNECGDCFYNDGDNDDGCHCELTGKAIEPMMKACAKFWLNPDFEEE